MNQRIGLLFLFGLMMLIAVAVGRLVTSSPLPIDLAFATWIHPQRTAMIDDLMRAGTHFGSILLLCPGAIAWGLWQHKKRHGAKYAAFVPLSLLFAWASGMLSKWLVARPRPSLFEPLIQLPLDASFPSGHTLQAAAFAFALALRPGPISVGAIFAAVLFVAFVGLSRLYLQVHWVSDVIAGALLGLGCVLILRHHYGTGKG